jgi:magnesium chelatase family protein
VCPVVIAKYQKRISVSILDRVDIHIEVPRVDYKKLSGDRVGESFKSIRTPVQAATKIQLERLSKIESSNVIYNANANI